VRVRHWPTASKFSIDRPIGSIMAWQLAHTGLRRCCAMRSRIVIACDVFESLSGGTLGGGGGGGVPRMFCRIHLPRITGEVRLGYAVASRMLPCPSKPPRMLSAGKVMRWNRLPYTFGIP